MILQQDQAKVARLLTENEEMKKLLREVNIPCSGDQKSMQVSVHYSLSVCPAVQ